MRGSGSDDALSEKSLTKTETANPKDFAVEEPARTSGRPSLLLFARRARPPVRRWQKEQSRWLWNLGPCPLLEPDPLLDLSYNRSGTETRRCATLEAVVIRVGSRRGFNRPATRQTRGREEPLTGMNRGCRQNRCQYGCWRRTIQLGSEITGGLLLPG
jgi:hypothetical protein